MPDTLSNSPVSGRFRSRFPGRLSSMAAAMATFGLLSACGGGGGSPDGSGGPAPSGISGSVAVGVPLTQGKVRVLDATGAVVASDIAVAADGSYNVPTLSGEAPFRIEACGYAGPDYTCVYSLAQGAGVANVTPLTSATVLLAAGQTPASLMSGESRLGAAAVDAAQQQLRTGLAGVLAGNVGSDFDFITGALEGGSRSGYDRVLDSVGVSTGVDGQAFVQISPRLGTGNLYLQQGSSSGTVTVDQAAAALPLDGLGALFARMSTALTSASACADANTGFASQLASKARINMEGESMTGPAQVGAALCQMFDSTGQWGATLLNPTLGRCDLSGAAPVCRVGFALQSPSGAVQNVGGGMGVVRENGSWKFLGSYFPVQFDVSARAQRDRRIDGGTVVDSYVRALAIGVPTVSGLQCAKASQVNPAGQSVEVAVLKRATGDHVKNLSIWRDAQTGERSLDPAAGSLRDADDSWLMLPQGGSGDELVRNFFRGGRNLTIALYSDSACTTPMSIGGRQAFEVDISGVPPVWDALPTLAWPELSPASAQALADLVLDANASTSLGLSWSFPNGRFGIGEMGFCSVANACGDGGSGRIGSGVVDASGSSATLNLHNGGSAIGDFRQLSLYGGTGEGLNLQSNFTVCRNRPAGQACW